MSQHRQPSTRRQQQQQPASAMEGELDTARLLALSVSTEGPCPGCGDAGRRYGCDTQGYRPDGLERAMTKTDRLAADRWNTAQDPRS
ncbi:hypothetical protein ColTof4_05836 [Colletotrichum tofieldiae]|nr:hypothetical protein ColTof3_01003 [Colletotrichum tofieldiae]GKT73413.1 hypothetical protein ColTof4_05836 [Colletotrichum tofieldiae]